MAPEAGAHLATWGSWDVTRRNLDVLFPTATDYLRKRTTLSAAEIVQVERALGFALYPEDKAPEFYIAVREEGGKKQLLGVALFVDPRSRPRVEGGEILRLEVGIGVDGAGKVKRVALYDYKGNPAMSGQAFLGQLVGRGLEDSFSVDAAGGLDDKGRAKVKAVSGEDEESQLIANAAFEALTLMKVALGR